MKKRKKQRSLGSKILCVAIAAALAVGIGCLAYYLTRYAFFDDYKALLKTYDYESGENLVLGEEKLPGNDDYALVAQTDYLKLYLNSDTTDVAVYDKRSGEITYAVPAEAEEDPIANGVNKNYLKSHLILNYYNSSRTSGIFDSYSMSVERDQFQFEGIENGVRVIYNMGDFSKSTGTVPQYMTEDKYEEILGQLSEADAGNFARYYTTNSDVPGMRQLLKTARNNRIAQERLQVMLEGVGFTEDDYVEQMSLAGDSVSIPVSFTVALEYRLKDDYVEVSVPVCSIEERGGAAVYKIDVLRNFGAAGMDETGYIVVPNGDGSIICFNNGKTAASNYSQYLYGIDPLAADYTVMETSNNASMSLYGLCKENATILATVESGASMAVVNAGVAGKVNSYNYAFTTFVIRGSEKLEMFGTTGNEAVLPIIEPEPYDQNLTIRYTFLDDSHSGYSGIAQYYRDRLTDEGVLQQKSADTDIKFYYDVISGVEMTEFFLGKQYMGLTAMTTFEEAGLMSNQLAEKGISNQVMNLQGWFNGGYYHDVADKIQVPGKLGGKSDLETLNRTVSGNGGSLYTDVAFQKVTNESKRYNYQAESSKYYGSGYVAAFGQVNPVTLRQTSSLGYPETLYDLISPRFLVHYVDSFANRIQNFDVDGISLRDLGSELHSDKKRSEIIDRENALTVVKAQLEKIQSTQKNVMVSQANDYAWGVADDILNLPLSDNAYILIDANIPLYEMIVHGSIDYCGGVYNLTNVKDPRMQILTMIEYGASPHFVFTWEETTKMKYSGLNNNYSTTFLTWADTAVNVYNEVNEALRQVDGEYMVSHTILENGVRKIDYSNGISVYVNYSQQDLYADGEKVPAMGYAVK